MAHYIEVTISLPVIIKKEKAWYIAICPILDVVSQGKTEAKAKDNLSDALYLFLISCYERGVLDEVLKKSGFRPTKKKTVPQDRDHEYIDVPLNLLSQKTQPKYCHA